MIKYVIYLLLGCIAYSVLVVNLIPEDYRLLFSLVGGGVIGHYIAKAYERSKNENL